MPGHFSHMRLSPISMIASFGAAHVRFSNGDSRFFINAKSYVSMQQAINQAPTNSMGALTATGLAAVLKSAFRIVFGEKVSMALAAVATRKNINAPVANSGRKPYLCSALHSIQATSSPTASAVGLFCAFGRSDNFIGSVPCGALMRPLPVSGVVQRGAGPFSVPASQHIVSF
jgi:hypothetical protein